MCGRYIVYKTFNSLYWIPVYIGSDVVPLQFCLSILCIGFTPLVPQWGGFKGTLTFNSLYWILRNPNHHHYFSSQGYLSILCIGFLKEIAKKQGVSVSESFNSLYWIQYTLISWSSWIHYTKTFQFFVLDSTPFSVTTIEPLVYIFQFFVLDSGVSGWWVVSPSIIEPFNSLYWILLALHYAYYFLV